MSKLSRLSVWAGVCLFLIFAEVSGLWAGMEAGFGDKGLSSLKVDGKEVLVNGQPTVTWIQDQTGKPVTGGFIASSFDPRSQTMELSYGWGKVQLRYEPKPEGLGIQASIQNTGTQTIGSIVINMIGVTALGEGRKIGPAAYGVEGPPLVTAYGPEASVVFFNRDPLKPLQLQLSENSDKKTGQKYIGAGVMVGGSKVIVDNVTSDRPIAPGAKEEILLTLVMAGPGSKPEDLAKDLLASYRASHPRPLKWDDRRIILRLFFGGGVTIPQAIENMKNPDAVKAPEPDPKFQAQFLARMKGTVEAAKFSNAQAVILWDLEGQTFPHATTYIGDPRLVRLLQPQMELIADEGVKILRDAGLKIGITLRPSRVIYDPAKNVVRHSYFDAKDPFEELSGKVEYAKKRWGCEIFYVDTNFFYRPYGADQKWQSGQITADVWKRLQEKYPNTLFIPEFGNIADYPYTVPYTEADMGGYGASPLIKAIWPDAFQVVVIEDADPYANFDRFVGSVRNGNPLMTYAFDPRSKNLVAAVRIYQQARLLDQGVPEAVAQAKPEGLAALLKSPEMAVRFHAARRLAEKPQAGDAPALLERAQDEKEDWLVRHASLRAFANLSYPPAVPVLVGFLKDQKEQLQEAAKLALVGQGEAGLVPVMGLMEAELTNTEGKFALVEDLGNALVLMKAASQAPALEALFAKVPDGKNSLALKKALVFVLARLKNPASELFFLSVLSQDKMQEAAATGLVLLGSEKGVAQVKTMVAEAGKAKDEVLVRQLNNALRAK